MNKEKVEPMVVDKNGNIYFSAIQYYNDINELKQRIDKAIEYIEKEPIDDEIEYTTILLDILRGEDNE